MKPKKIGVSIPFKLFELVMSAEPGRTFSDVVRDALIQKYGFVEFRKGDLEPNEEGCTVDDELHDIEKRVDGLSSGA